MSEEKNAQLATEHPGTPDEWTAELDTHSEKARRVVFRFARSRGAFLHAVTVQLEPAGPSLFALTLEDEGSEVTLPDYVRSRRVVEHGWAVLCNLGIAYSIKHDLTRLRGEMEILDSSGVALNDAATCRKVLRLENPTAPWTSDDDELSAQDVGLMAQLRYERAEHRRTAQRLTASYERDENRAEARAQLERMHVNQTLELGKATVDFSNYKAEMIRNDVEAMRGEMRRDYVLEEMVKILGPKLGMIADAAGVYLRTGGGRRDDARQVPKVPSDVLLWGLSVWGPEGYAQLSSEIIKADARDPGSLDYRQAWADVLGILDNSLAPDSLGGNPIPEKVAEQLSAWAKFAVAAIEGDEHVFSRVVFASGSPETPPDPPESDGDES